jgi:hypothetical protein
LATRAMMSSSINTQKAVENTTSENRRTLVTAIPFPTI